MKTTSSGMSRYTYAVYLLITAAVISLSSCRKEEKQIDLKFSPPVLSSQVLDKWITMQLRLMRNATGISNHGMSRHFAYSGVAAIESLRPGMHGKEAPGNWNGLTGLPVASQQRNYYYPANVNAAMAAINKALFPNASAIDKMAIDSLETALNESFLTLTAASRINQSIAFGKAVATAVFNWSETDGYKNASNPYSIPVGAGLWKPTPPAFANPATPYWGNNRTIVFQSTMNSPVSAPLAYSTDPGSPFYQMVKEVYDASQSLTEDQKQMAIFWRDVPGTTSPGHWLSIMQQVMRSNEASLDEAALAYALTGAAVNDALIACFKSKYTHNLVRPVTYIREVMGHTSWNPYLTTPAHPEYASAHSALSIAAARVLQTLFGEESFTDHTYDYLGLPARSYPSLYAIGLEAGLSRLYAGIHYRQSIEMGTSQGNTVAVNILKDLFYND